METVFALVDDPVERLKWAAGTVEHRVRTFQCYSRSPKVGNPVASIPKSNV